MTFLQPSNFIWAALAGIILVMYLKKPGHRQHQVSTNLLWNRTLAKRPAWLKVQRLVSMALQLAILFLLVIAFMQPVFFPVDYRPRSIVLIMDTSASMNATDVTPSRLASCIPVAEEWIKKLFPDDEMAILSSSSGIAVNCRFTNDPEKLLTTIQNIRGSDGKNQLDAAVNIARKMLTDKNNPSIIVMTDGVSNETRGIIGSQDVQVHLVPTTDNNVAISKFAARQSLTESDTYQVFWEITNFSEKPTSGKMRLGLANEAPTQIDYQLAAQESHHQTTNLKIPQGGLLTATLTNQDALSVDNQAYLLLPPRSPLKVHLVSQHPLLIQALQAMPSIELNTSEQMPETISQQTVYVFYQGVPAKMPNAPSLTISPEGNTDLWERAGNIEDPRIVQQQSDSPLFADIDLRKVVFERGNKLNFTTDSITLASNASNDAIYTLIQRPTADALVFSAKLEASDLPLRDVFPLMISNAIRYLGNRTTVELPNLKVGDSLAVQFTEQTRYLKSPYGEYFELPTKPTLLGPFDQAGVWGVYPSRDSNSPEMLIVANFVNPKESKLASTLPKSEEVTIPTSAERIDLAFIFVGLALLLAAFEWGLFHRKITI